MVKIKYFLCFITVCISILTQAQSLDKKVLFTVNNTPIEADEFVRVYKKNLDLVKDKSQKDIDNYLQLYIDYKLKLEEAFALKLNEDKTYLQEFNRYKKQLAKNFLAETKVTKALVKEAYQRLQYDINASHILIRMNPDEQDTLKYYKEIVRLRDRVVNEGFDEVKKEVHNGRTIYGEDLGYFSGFKMVYPFENVAYNTAVNDISRPFKTRFGYHILKVKDKRKSRGKITVAHIMVALTPKQESNAKERIQEIYKKLNQGESFETLAKQFSEDKSTAKKGGVLAPFSGGQLSSLEFENEAFGLKNRHDTSAPFKTKYGWHIIKLINKQPIGTLEDLKPEIEAKIKADSRSKIINKSRVTELQKKYKISYNQPALAYFKSIVNASYFNKGWKLPKDFLKDKPLINLKNKTYTYQDFGSFLLKSQKRYTGVKNVNTLVDNLYKQYLDNALIQYQEDNLEFENKEFKYLLNEYRDGLLLFNLMDSKIWQKAKTDTAALQNYFKNNRDKYIWEQRFKGKVASSSSKDIISEVAQLLEQGKSIKQIKEVINTKEKINVIFTEQLFNKDHQAIPKELEFKEGVSKIYAHNNGYIVAKIDSVLPKSAKTLKESKGLVTSNFQEHLEKNWLALLRKKYNVKVNHKVLKRVKKSIK